MAGKMNQGNMDHEKLSVEESAILSTGLIGGQDEITDSESNLPNYSLETSPPATDSKSDTILVKIGIEKLKKLPESPISSISVEEVEGVTLRESSCSSARNFDPSEVLEDKDSSSKMSQVLRTEVKNMAILSDNFRVLRNVVQSVKPMSELMEDKDVDIDEVFVENSTRFYAATDVSSNAEQLSSKKSSRVPGFITASTDPVPDYRVSDVSDEADTLSSKNESTSNVRYERNLKNFLKETETLNKTISPENEKRQLKRKIFSIKTFRSDGALSDILPFCGVVTSILRKLKIERKSKSAPPSFSDVSSNQLKLPKNLIQINESADEILNQSLNVSECPRTEAGFVEESRSGDAAHSDETESQILLEIICKNNGLQLFPNSSEASTSDESQRVFKIPVLPKGSTKSHDLSLKVGSSSPGTSKIPVELKGSPMGLDSPRSSPRRPTDFNVSPRRAVYMFCPRNPMGFFRQYRSLPNICQPPRKDDRRASMDIEKYKNHSSVKTLFTGKIKPKTPESFTSSVVVEEAVRKFLLSQSKVDNHSDPLEQTSLDKTSDSKHPKSSSSHIIHLSCKSKIRKKLIFVSHTSENTNVTSTLQDSSSSLDISTDISNLELEDSENAQKLKISLIESPPKRKHGSPDKCVPRCSSFVTKKLRISDEIKMKKIETTGTDACDEELQAVDKIESHAAEQNLGQSDGDCPAIKSMDMLKTSGNVTVSTDTSSEVLHIKIPVVQFPEEDLEVESESKRTPLKRTQLMSSAIIEDISDTLSDPKRKRESK